MNELEERLFSFICELAEAVSEITYCALYEEPVFYFGNYEINLLDICDLTKAEARKFLEENDISVQEMRENDEVAAYLECEGKLYEGLYSFEAMGSEMWGEDTKKIYDALNSLAEKYGLWYEWSSGALTFYLIIDENE